VQADKNKNEKTIKKSTWLEAFCFLSLIKLNAMKQNIKEEQIEISFLGFKFKCSNPTSKALIILMMLLIFFVVLVLLAPKLNLIKWFSG
jgi:hypothetical protein